LPPLTPNHMKKRADFLRAQRGVRKVAGGLTLEICVTPAKAAQAGGYRVGFTASRKVGNAVLRNRAKRRLRAAAAALLPGLAHECTDYVLVARQLTLTQPFPRLLEDLATTLKTAHVKLEAMGDRH
jgi:ribonuclease P protein component